MAEIQEWFLIEAGHQEEAGKDKEGQGPHFGEDSASGKVSCTRLHRLRGAIKGLRGEGGLARGELRSKQHDEGGRSLGWY